MDFTAIDFETANGFRGSPCAVGLSKVRGGVVVEEASWLMRPPENHDRFDYHNVRIHGIRPEDVAGLPRFGELFPEIGAFIGGDVLAAHNAAFDLGVIRSGLEVSGLPGPAYDYVCTVMLSRRCYSLVSNSLPYAAEEAGVPLVNHHDAAEDARACAGILIDIARAQRRRQHRRTLPVPGPGAARTSRPSIPRATACPRPRSPPWRRWPAATEPRRCGAFQSGWPEEGANPVPNADAEPGHPLFGQTVVFTGELAMPRPEAKVRRPSLAPGPKAG